MKRPSLGAIAVGCLPLFAVCFSVPLWDRVHPMVLGLPFNFFWLILWILITTLSCLGRPGRWGMRGMSLPFC